MRLFVVDNNLEGKIGHFYAIDLWIKKEASKRGIDARFFINRSATDEIIKTLSAQAIFSYSSYGGTSRDKLSGHVDNFLHVGLQLATELQFLTSEGLSGNDIVFFPMVSQNDIFGCAIWLNRIPHQSRPYVCMNFMRPSFVYLYPQNDTITLSGILCRSAAKILLQSLGKEKLIYTAQSASMAKLLSKLLYHPATESPMLHTYNLPANQDKPTAVKKFVAEDCRILIIGGSRVEKGFHHVPDLLELLTIKISNPSFFVQVTTELHHFKKEIARLQTMANVELHLGYLEEAAYFEKLRDTDIVLLPYDPLLYKYLTSGIFAEAVAMGKVVVAPDSSWMAEQINNKKGAGKLFNSFDPPSIADAVLAAIEDYETLHSDAVRYAETWKNEQNLGIYLEGLLTTVDKRIKAQS